MAINRTVQLLSDMEYVICVPNKLENGKDPGCVDVTTANTSMTTGNASLATTCNTTEVAECLAAIGKAFHNPFLSRSEFCR